MAFQTQESTPEEIERLIRVLEKSAKKNMREVKMRGKESIFIVTEASKKDRAKIQELKNKLNEQH